MASIKKTKSGKYQAIVYIGRDDNGKILRKCITRDGWKECRDAARELEDEVASKSLSNLSMMTMDKYMDKWFEIIKPTIAPTTRKEYKRYINKHFRPFFGKKIKVYQVTDMKIKEYIALKLETLSPTTVRKHFFTLSKLFFDALKHNSPCIGIKAPQNAPYSPRIPTDEEFNQIHEVFKEISLEDEIIILLAGWCGLRRGEIFAINLKGIYEDLGVIFISEAVALEEEGYQFEIKDPKSENGIRSIAVEDYLMEQIKLRIKQLRQDNSKIVSINKKRNDEDIFLCTQNPHSFSKKFARVIKENSLPKIRFHDLRHYHATDLYNNNYPDHYAAKRLGHDITVLKKKYQHLGLEKQNELDKKIREMQKNKSNKNDNKREQILNKF